MHLAYPKSVDVDVLLRVVPDKDPNRQRLSTTSSNPSAIRRSSPSSTMVLGPIPSSGGSQPGLSLSGLHLRQNCQRWPPWTFTNRKSDKRSQSQYLLVSQYCGDIRSRYSGPDKYGWSGLGGIVAKTLSLPSLFCAFLMLSHIHHHACSSLSRHRIIFVSF